MDQIHHTNAPQSVRERIRFAAQETGYPHGDGNVTNIAALGWLHAVRCAARHGYVIPAAEIPMPAHTELARLELEEPTLAGRFRAMHSLDLQYETQARVEAENAERSVPDRLEAQRQEQEKHKAAAEQAELERRTHEILESEEAAEKVRRAMKARTRAAKELGQ